MTNNDRNLREYNEFRSEKMELAMERKERNINRRSKRKAARGRAWQQTED
jgi:hypothetical protein